MAKVKSTIGAMGFPADAVRKGLIGGAKKAGQYPGLGDGRPQRIKGKGLWFGKYRVIELEIEPLEE